MLKLPPMRGLFISGSNTNVGKTFIASYIIQALNTKYHVAVRKPIESNCTKINNGLLPKDAILLSSVCKTPEPIDVVCRFKLEACASGEKASAKQGLDITLQDLIDASQPNNSDDFMVIEGSGGLYSPIAKQSLNIDFAVAIGLPVVIVVKDELGAVNQALLSVEAAKKHQLKIAMLVLNQINPNHLENDKALNAYTEATVVVFNKNNMMDFSAKILAL